MLALPSAYALPLIIASVAVLANAAENVAALDPNAYASNFLAKKPNGTIKNTSAIIDVDVGDKNVSMYLSSKRNSIRFMSYNIMGWASCKYHPDRGVNIFEKIANYNPAVLGAQEVETGGGQGWDECASQVSAAAHLTTGAGSQFFDADVVEQHESMEREILYGMGYWISMTRYRHKRTRDYFLFFNSHWKHGYSHDQAHEVANFISDQRAKYNSAPSILLGDNNQWNRMYDSYAYRYLTGQEGSSPVTFFDAHPHDLGRSFGHYGDSRVDFILASKGQWSLISSEIDRDGMGENGEASDHAALMAELSIRA